MPRLTREQSRQITRDKLRASAIREISATGFAGASIDRICESAGFSRGAFYANFRNKDDLLLDIVRTHHSREVENLVSLLRSSGGAESLIPILREQFALYLADDSHILFATELGLYARRHPPFRKRYRAELLSLDFRAEQVLEALYQAAGKAPHRPLPQLAQAMRGLLSGLALDLGGKTAEATAAADIVIGFLEDLLVLGNPVHHRAIAAGSTGLPAGSD